MAHERRIGGLWWHRDFRLLWVGETTSKIGSALTTIAIPLVAVTNLQASSFMVGVLTAVSWFPWVCFGLLAGAWVDRMRRRPIMLVCNVSSMLAFGSVPIVAWLGELTMVHLLGAALVGGAGSVFFTTAYQAYLPSLIDPEDLAEGNAKLQGSEAAANVAGPGLGGLIMQMVSALTGLLVDALTFLVSTFCLLKIRARESAPKTRTKDSTIRTEIRYGLRFVFRDQYLRPLAIYAALANLAFIGLQTLMVVFLVRTVGVEAGTVGVLVAIGGTGGIIGALVARWFGNRYGTARSLILCALGATPFGFLIPLTFDGVGLLLFPVGVILLDVGAIIGNVLAVTFRQQYCPPHLLGRVSASMRFVSYGAIPLGALLGGGLGSLLGNRSALFVIFSIYLAAGLVLVASPIRRRRDMPTTQVTHFPAERAHSPEA